MSDSPSESTLVVNVTHRQLRSLNPPFSRLVAIAPTRVEEGAHRNAGAEPEGGYDISLETVKEVVFQHKRPFDMIEHQGTEWLKFDVDTEQCWALAEQYELGQAFLALPVVPSAKELPFCLGLTAFVDVHLIDHFNDSGWMPKDGDSISTIYVERSDDLVDEIRNASDLSRLDNSVAPAVHIKSNTRQWKMGGPAYQDISMEDFRSPANDCAIAWTPLAEFIKSCRYGVRIRGGTDAFRPVPVTGALQRFLPEEIPSETAPAYRNRVARTRALAALSDVIAAELDRGELVAAIAEDIVDRREAMDDFFRFEIDPEAVSARANRAVQQFWGDPMRFQRIARQTSRHIIEGGDKSNELVIE